MGIPVEVSTARQDTRNTFLIQTHESFRKEMLQRENNFISEFSVFIVAITGFGAYIGKHDFSDPGVLLLVMGGAILVSLLGIHLCNLHGYQFRFCLFQMHKIECMLEICDTSLLKWHRYCSYLIANDPGKSTKEYMKILNKKSINCNGCEMIEKIGKKLKSGTKCQLLDPLKIEPPNVLRAFQYAFYVFITVVLITSFTICLSHFQIQSQIRSVFWGTILVEENLLFVFFLAVSIIVFATSLGCSINGCRGYRRKFRDLVNAEFDESIQSPIYKKWFMFS